MIRISDQVRQLLARDGLTVRIESDELGETAQVYSAYKPGMAIGWVSPPLYGSAPPWEAFGVALSPDPNVSIGIFDDLTSALLSIARYYRAVWLPRYTRQ